MRIGLSKQMLSSGKTMSVLSKLYNILVFDLNFRTQFLYPSFYVKQRNFTNANEMEFSEGSM
jgi:hypothetical protein